MASSSMGSPLLSALVVGVEHHDVLMATHESAQGVVVRVNLAAAHPPRIAPSAVALERVLASSDRAAFLSRARLLARFTTMSDADIVHVLRSVASDRPGPRSLTAVPGVQLTFLTLGQPAAPSATHLFRNGGSPAVWNLEHWAHVTPSVHAMAMIGASVASDGPSSTRLWPEHYVPTILAHQNAVNNVKASRLYLDRADTRDTRLAIGRQALLAEQYDALNQVPLTPRPSDHYPSEDVFNALCKRWQARLRGETPAPDMFLQALEQLMWRAALVDGEW